MLNAMLLNGLQRQHREFDEVRLERRELQELKADDGSLWAVLRQVRQRLEQMGPQAALWTHR